MIPGKMEIEKVHGLQCTGITLSERFAQMAAEYLARRKMIRRRNSFLNNQNQNMRFQKLITPSQMTLRMSQQALQHTVKQRLGMPGLRRFGSDGNLPGLQRSNSFGNMSQFRNRIPWRQSNGNMSRAGSVSNLSQAGRTGVARRARTGRVRGRGRLQRGRQQVGVMRQRPRGAAPQRGRGGVRGRGRGRGVNRSQQGRLQQAKKPPTKEELDKQLDEYMATSQFVLDKELEDYMLKGSLMDFE